MVQDALDFETLWVGGSRIHMSEKDLLCSIHNFIIYPRDVLSKYWEAVKMWQTKQNLELVLYRYAKYSVSYFSFYLFVTLMSMPPSIV